MVDKQSPNSKPDSPKLEEDRARLNLRPTGDILKCHGRIQGDFPIYLPDNDLYTEKLVEQSHNETLYGGVSLTMTKVREIYWITRLRRLAKRVLKRCFGCRRFQAIYLFQTHIPENCRKIKTKETYLSKLQELIMLVQLDTGNKGRRNPKPISSYTHAL